MGRGSGGQWKRGSAAGRQFGMGIALLSVLLLMSPRGVQAQEREPTAGETEASRDAQARALFAAGQSAYEGGRYQAALGHFRASFELSGRPQLLYNIGLAEDRLRHDQEALTAFESFLEQVPNSPLREQVAARAELLRQAIAQEISPEEVAAAEERAAQQGAHQALAQRDREERGVAHKWWFWTVLGAVVAGAAVGIVVGTSGGDRQAPLPGDEGVVIRALRAE